MVPPMSNFPTVSEIAHIADLPDPAMRNLQITLCYHRLGLALAERTGREANWCVFATWASKQAGQTIRKEDLARSLEAALGDADRIRAVEKFIAGVRRIGVRLKTRKLVELLWQALDPEGAFTHSSEAVARGNLKVFAEIAHEFARFYTACLPAERFDGGSLNAFLDGLRSGPPPDGQDHLRKAFRCYYEALFATDPAGRSQFLFLANLLVGLHEQTRLQPEIVEALEAPVISPRTFVQNLLQAYYPDKPWLANAVHIILRAAGRLVGFDAFVDAYLAGARRQAQNLTTLALMMIELPPGVRLRLGQDLTGDFPPALQRITNVELAELLAKIDPTPDSRSESGAVYWGDLPDRIHFIADLFRSRHAAAELFEPPFDPDQIAALGEGRLPAGRL